MTPPPPGLRERVRDQDPVARSILADWYEAHGELSLATCLREQSDLRGSLVIIVLDTIEEKRRSRRGASVTAAEVAKDNLCGKSTARTVLESLWNHGILSKRPARSGGKHPHPAIYCGTYSSEVTWPPCPTTPASTP